MAELKRESHSRGWGQVPLAGVLALAALLGVIVAVAPLPGAARVAEAADTVIELRATDTVIALGSERIDPGRDVQWRNRSGRTLAVTSPDGLLDSGPIPDGGSFYASLPIARSYPWETDVGGGTLYTTAEFIGAPGDPANESIPDLVPPPVAPTEISLHPTLRIELPRNRVLVGFTDDSTVAQAEAALGSDWVIVGGLPLTRLVYLERRFPSTVFPTSQIGSLRSKPGVDFVSYLFPIETSALPPESAESNSVAATWEDPSIAPDGSGLNFRMELSRLPQAWNLLDSLAVDGALDRGSTLIVDSAFERHDDLDRLEILQTCAYQGVFCSTANAAEIPTDHGNHVAGIIGADHDEWGVSGADPFSRLLGFPWRFGQGTASRGNLELAMELLARRITTTIPADRIDIPDVVNLSIQNGIIKADAWWPIWSGENCGPGPADDATGTDVCTPSNEDGQLFERAQTGKTFRRAVEAIVRASVGNVPLFVSSTGNSSTIYCRDGVGPCAASGAVPQDAALMGSPMSWAERNWNPGAEPALGVTPPIISVESLGDVIEKAVTPSRKRSGFSNINGDISVGGLALSAASSPTESTPEKPQPCQTGTNPSASAQSYCLYGGTSMAAPVVSGIAGLLVAADPTLDADGLRTALLDWAVADTTDGASPRADAFASMLSLPGMARRLVDVNDPSTDGNRRVVRDSTGTEVQLDTTSSTTATHSTEPDGVVDLRDFRRFRDAWLLRCSIDPEAGCPTEIALDGPADHPKFDLNLDGCVSRIAPTVGLTCASEATFPRLDFNGDGSVSRNLRSLMPLQPDGTAASGPDQATTMTDLQVLQRLWDADEPGTTGVEASELDDLMLSGDVTADVGSLRLAAGTESVTVEAVDVTTGTVSATAVVPAGPGTGELVLTVPASRPVNIVATGVGPGAASAQWGPLILPVGSDCQLDACGGVTIDAPKRSLRPGESMTVTVGVVGTGNVEGVPVDLSLDPFDQTETTFAGGVGALRVVTGTDGTATTDVTAGSTSQAYTITATATIETAPGITSSQTTRFGFAVAEAYDLDVVAVDGAGSGYLALDEWARPGDAIGPSVNGLGDVAFGGLMVADDRYRVFIAPQGSTSTDPLTTEQGVGTTTDEFIVDDVQINNARQVAYAVTHSFDGELETTIRRSTGTTTVVFDTASTADVFTGPFFAVGRPTMNAAGRIVHVGDEDEASFVTTLAERIGADVVTGLSGLGLRPRLADDGTTVTDIAVERRCTEHPERTCSAPEAAADQFFDTAVVAGDSVQASGSFTIAEQRTDGWGGLSDPDISPSGDAIVFTGERTGAAGTFLALRDPVTGWQEPVAIAGPAASSSVVVDVEGSRPNIAQVALGGTGPVDDLFVIAMVGRTSPTGPLGVHTVRLIVVATTDPLTPFALTVEGSDPVIEVGDAVEGSTVDSVVLADSIAEATAPTNVFDHWVAVHVRLADGRNAIVRAHALAPPTPPVIAVPLTAPVAVPLGFRAVGLTSSFDSALDPTAALLGAPTASALLAEELVVLAGPHVAAVTVDDDTPVARVPTRVTNRSRAIDGTPASAVLDEIGSGALEVLTNPLLLGPDESTTLELPDVGAPGFAVGAPVTAGGDANDVTFSFTVEKGANRPPTGTLTGAPYTILSGESLALAAVTADPDGDGRTVAWDLDHDGAFDDGTFWVNLTGAQVATVVCGGTCALDTPYPIAARVLDARGLDTVLSSTVTITSPGAIDLQVQPTLVRINPGQSGTVYVDLSDSSASLPARVSTTAEGLPAGWTTNLSSTVTTGTVVPVRINVPPSELEGSFAFDIVGRLGAEEWRRPVTVVTQFGLVPRCTTQIGGMILDDVGAPIAGATVTMTLARSLTARTDATGSFQMLYLAAEPELSEGFETQRIASWRVTAPGYVSANLPAFTVDCNGTAALTATLRPLADLAGMNVRAVRGIENPVMASRPLSTAEPIEGATVTFAQTASVITGIDGRAAAGPLPFETSAGLRPSSVQLRVEKAGFWTVTRSVPTADIDPTEILDVGDVVLLPQCTATVTGGRVVDQHGDPVEGAVVNFTGTNLPPVVSRPDGTYVLDRTVVLGTWNTATSRIVRATAPTVWATGDVDQVTAAVNRCGESISVPTLHLERPAPADPDLFGDLVGTVADATSGDPVAGAIVRVYPAGAPAAELGRATVAPDGSWSIADLLVGTDPSGVRSLGIETTKSGFWPDTRTVTLPANATGSGAVAVAVTLLAQQRVTVSGTVTDVDTGEPIPGVTVDIGGKDQRRSVTTDAEGRYIIGDLLLDVDNQPFATTVVASFGPDPRSTPSITHWSTGRPYTLTTANGQVVDLQMVPICASSSISGSVFDASTLLPIDGATVAAGRFTTLTDAAGRYRIDGIRPDELNAPRRVLVLANALGFFESSVTVTTVCGSDLVVDFGRPPAGFGTVRGTVVDGNDTPLRDVDVGTPWGDVITTGADGTFLFDRAPLAPDGGDRIWTILAVNGPMTLRQDASVGSVTEAVITFRFDADEPDPQNRPPAVELAATGTFKEGDTVSFDASATTDPDGDELTFAWILLDAGGTPVATGSGTRWAYDSTDDVTGTIRLVVTDARDASTRVERPVVITNVAPSVTIADATLTPAAQPLLGPLVAALSIATVELRATFTDPGTADTHTVTIDWGDGSSETVAHQGATILAAHSYDTTGTPTIAVQVCDDDDGCARTTRLVEIPTVVDPTPPPPVVVPTVVTPPVVNPTAPIAQPPTSTPAPRGGDPNATLPETGNDAGSLLMTAIGLLLLGLALTASTRSTNRAQRSRSR